jgi:chromate transporter
MQEIAVNEAICRKMEVAGAFLKFGALSYGGPALFGVLQSEFQERRAWLTKERFLEGMALVQALPGATLVQMCIFVGHQRAGTWGGLIAGIAFTLPAFFIMLAFASLHAAFGAASVIRDAFYGIAPVVLAIFAVALYRLGKNAVKARTSVMVALAAAALAYFTHLGLAATFLFAGCAGVALYHSKLRGVIAALTVALAVAAERALVSMAGIEAFGAQGAGDPSLADIGVFFLKVGAVTFGGGISILGFIQDQVVARMHWITAEQFLDGLALGQVTPGPVIMVAAFVGYRVLGVAGAAVATLAIFLPSFLLLLAILPVVDRVRGLAWVKAAMRGIGPAVVGTIAVAIAQLVPHAAPDVFTAIVLVLTVAAQFLWKLHVLSLLVAGGVIGVLARSFISL